MTSPVSSIRSCRWLARLGWVLPIALGACLIARCAILSDKRLLWADELLSWYPASASFGAMLRSTTDTINSAPPLYFVLTWLWTGALGNTALTLRLFSAVASTATILILFAVLRRPYGVLASALALGLAFGDADLFFQSAEARFHALFVAEGALGILLYQRVVARPAPTRLLLLNGLAHACMALTSYTALLYCGAIFCATFFSCRLRGFSPKHACYSIAAGWLVFLPWIPAFRRHSRMGKPSSWIQVPELGHLQHYAEGYLTKEFWIYAALLLVFAGIASGLAAICGGRLRRLGAREREAPLLLLAAFFLAMPFAVYLLSIRKGYPSIFLPRYMLPTLLGWVIVCAHLAHRALLPRHALGRPGLTRCLITIQAIAVVAFLGYSGGRTVWDTLLQGKASPPEDILASIPGNERIVIENIHDFLEWRFYSREPSRLLFIVDLQVGVREGGGGPLNHRIMAALKRQFPDQFKEVMSTEEFLGSATSFWVRRRDSRWSELRLQNNPAFVVAQIGNNLLHVRRAPLEEAGPGAHP
jgi:uncharacterized membrane protein